MVDVEELHRLFKYDPETGIITNRCSRPRRKAGEEAGCLRPTGYRTILVNRKDYRAHRVAWAMHHGSWPPEGMQVDHINRVRDDNRACNLRVVTGSVNQHNRSRTKGRGLPCGVWEVSGRFRAKIRSGGVQHCLGTFDTPEEASFAYQTAKTALHTASTQPITPE